MVNPPRTYKFLQMWLDDLYPTIRILKCFECCIKGWCLTCFIKGFLIFQNSSLENIMYHTFACIQINGTLVKTNFQGSF
ncbi:hypothetical protein HanRHA438_Chr08g0355051 [Helianthus annuus]|nr:hypothetical protein HanRHA438_Chr08g0355051 [Helianthus annuus]